MFNKEAIDISNRGNVGRGSEVKTRWEQRGGIIFHKLGINIGSKEIREAVKFLGGKEKPENEGGTFRKRLEELAGLREKGRLEDTCRRGDGTENKSEMWGKVTRIEEFLKEKSRSINSKIHEVGEKYPALLREKVDKVEQSLRNHPATTTAILCGLVAADYIILANGSGIPDRGVAPYYFLVKDLIEKAGGNLYLPSSGGISTIPGSVFLGEGIRRVVQNEKVIGAYNKLKTVLTTDKKVEGQKRVVLIEVEDMRKKEDSGKKSRISGFLGSLRKK